MNDITADLLRRIDRYMPFYDIRIEERIEYPNCITVYASAFSMALIKEITAACEIYNQRFNMNWTIKEGSPVMYLSTYQI